MKISIITVNYNNVKGLEKTFKSVLEQSYDDYEFVVVDGGSNDGSKHFIEREIPKFKKILWVSEKDSGIYNAMNKGTRMSNGDFCLFMNSGDCFYDKNSLKKSLQYLKDGVDIASGAVKTDDFSKDAPKESELSLSFFVKDSLNHQSTFIRRQLLLDYPYDERRKIVADSEFFCQALILHDASYIRIPFKVSYCESGGVSRNVLESVNERYVAIKSLLPNRMNSDVDFIAKYHNPIIIKIGNMLYKPLFRKTYEKIRKIKNAIINS